ncbi:MAG: carbohydrate ABC transporter permease [Candidatus Dormibacteraeota bacterium]|nr:carbohydrate ABC transporter permease [Candidatus Dormibacteraeota bacterium]
MSVVPDSLALGRGRPGSRGRRRVSLGSIPLVVLLAIAAVLTIAPFLVMVTLAVSRSAAASIPYQLPTRFTLANFQEAIQASGFLRWTENSAIYAVVSVVIVLLTASMAGYAFARKRFWGRDALLWSMLATLMVPAQATLIPLFVLVSRLGGVDTYWGLIVPTLANAQAVFLLRQFIRDLPQDYFDAAKVDGASEFRIFFGIVIPLCRPVLATLGVFVFLWHWNDFLWPLVVGQSASMRVLTVGLASIETQSVTVPQVMAAATITMLPCLVVFVLLQRYLVSTMAMSGVKG